MAGTVEVYTIGYPYLYDHTLNAIALILKQPYIASLIKGTEVTGLLLVIVHIKKYGLHGLSHWLLTVLFSFSVLFSGNVTVRLLDLSQMGASQATTVSGIPYGLAILMSLMNNIGVGLTMAFDNVLHGSHDPRYCQTGFLMNQRIVGSIKDYRIADPTLAQNVDHFIQNCVFYDILLNAYPVESLTNSSNIMHFLETHAGVNRGIMYHHWVFRPEGGKEETDTFMTCREAVKALKADFTKDVPNMIHRVAPNIYRILRSRGEDDFKARLVSELGTSFSYLARENSVQAASLVKQAAWSNAIKQGIRNFASEANSASGLMNAIAFEKAKNQKNINNQLMAVFGREYLPLAKPLLECALYFGYIFVAVLMLLPNRLEILWFYMKLLMWINLWSPIFAIFDAMSSYLTQEAMQAKMDLATHISFNNYQAVAEMNLELAAIAGYLSFSATAYIAFYMVSHSSQMMNTMAGLLSQDLTSHVQHAASELGAHQLSLGNSSLATASYDSEQGMQLVNRFHLETLSTTEETQSGSVLSHHANGTESLNVNPAISQLPIKPTLSEGLTQSFAKQYDKKQEMLASQQHHLQAAQHLVAEKGKHLADFVNHLDDVTHHQNVAKLDGFHQAVDDNDAHKNTHSNQQAAEEIWNRTGRASVGFGLNSRKLFAKVLPLTGQLEGIVEKTHSGKGSHLTVNDHEHAVIESVRMDALLNVLDQYNTTHHDEMGKRLEKEYRASASHLKEASEAFTKSQSDMESLSQHKSFVDNHAASIAASLEQPFYTYLHERFTNDEITEMAEDPAAFTALASDYIHSHFDSVVQKIDELKAVSDFQKNIQSSQIDLFSHFADETAGEDGSDFDPVFREEKTLVEKGVKAYQKAIADKDLAIQAALDKASHKRETE